MQIAQLLRDYTSAVTNANSNRITNGGTAGEKALSRNGSLTGSTNGSSTGSTGRRKSVEFDLALRNMSKGEKQHKTVNFSGLAPVPQPRRSLLQASYDSQFYIQQQQQQQQQLYQNQQQIQYQMIQQQQQLQQRRPRPLI